MDVIGWLLLLVVAVCVVALIIITRKRKELEERMSYETVSDSLSTTNKPPEEEGVPKQDPPQETIYEYCLVNKTQLCTLCDGENDASATQCYICGQPLE